MLQTSKKTAIFLSILVILFSCNRDPNTDPLDPPSNPNLKYFGYTLVDVYFDDPTDDDVKINYVDEVSSFSNIADILVVEPSQDIKPNLDIMDGLDVKALIHLNEIFYEIAGEGGEMSGVFYDLRTDYRARWDELMEVNKLKENADKIQALYLGEEPTWNGISFEELRQACDYVKQTLPEVKIFLVEAFPALEALEVPESVDWLGFDHYFVKDPARDSEYLAEFELLKSKRSNDQDLVIILDAHYIDFAHGHFGIAINDLDLVAQSYYDLANSDEDVVAMIGYHWPSGFEFPQAIGTRGLPEYVLDEHKRIGKAISGK